MLVQDAPKDLKMFQQDLDEKQEEDMDFPELEDSPMENEQLRDLSQ